MEDRGRSSRTYENRRTYGKSQERRPSDNHPPRRKRTPAERARMRRRRKRQRMIRFVLLIILIICSNCRNHFVETLQPIKRTI